MSTDHVYAKFVPGRCGGGPGMYKVLLSEWSPCLGPEGTMRIARRKAWLAVGVGSCALRSCGAFSGDELEEVLGGNPFL